MAHNKSDHKIVPVSKQFYATWTLAYNAAYKKYLPPLFPQLDIAAARLKNMMNLSGKEVLILKPIKGNTTGLHFHNNRIFIDPRRGLFHAVETLAHELVHAEQAHRGDLIPGGPHCFRQWKGNNYSMPRNWVEYRNFPWEVEAYDRQTSLARQALGIV